MCWITFPCVSWFEFSFLLLTNFYFLFILLTFFILSPLCPLLCFPQYPFSLLLAFISITIILYFSQLIPHFLLCCVLSLIFSNYSCFVVFPHRQLFTMYWCIVFNLSQCFNYNFYLLQGNISPMNVHCCYSVAKSCPTFCDPISSVQFSSVAQSCLILCNPMDCSTSGFPVHQQLLELTQTHVH